MTSYMTRHRPICEVLTEIQNRAQQLPDDYGILKLTEEALDYARRMSARLTEYKYKENTSNES